MATVKAPTTQENVLVAGIRDGIVILRNGQYRIVMSVAAINFDLKSEQEQNSIIFNYQSFLNSLHFPIEILISSKKLDLTPYLNKIKKLAEKQKNELLKLQTEDYVDFVSQLINLANIMKKTFYVTVGYQPLVTNNGGILDKLFKKNNETAQLRVSEEDYARYTTELKQRATTVAQGLGSIGLHCKQLNTQEVIELLYSTYNPEVAGKERLAEEANTFASAFVTHTKDKEDEALEPSQIEDESTIDNTEIVNAQQKKEQEERQQAIEKNAERDMKAPTTSNNTVSANTNSSNAPSTAPAPPAAEAQEKPATPQSQTAETQTKAQSQESGTSINEPPQNRQTPPQPNNPPVNPKATNDPDSDPALNKDFGW
ncbi:MAG: hypothetical protein WC080_03275 [Patescibacteria group bacterium]